MTERQDLPLGVRQDLTIYITSDALDTEVKLGNISGFVTLEMIEKVSAQALNDIRNLVEELGPSEESSVRLMTQAEITQYLALKDEEEKRERANMRGDFDEETDDD